MKYHIYRSLDRPSSFFGIKGKFIILVGLFAGAFAIIALVLGAMFGSALVGLGIFLGGTAIGFVVTLTLQGRMSVKQLSRFLSSRNFPEFIKVRPVLFIHKVNMFE